MVEKYSKYDQELISILAHDLRTPINSTRHFMDLANHAGRMGNDEKQSEYMERAQQGLSRMSQLIDDVLEMSRLEQDAKLNLEPCDLAAQIQECLQMLEGAAMNKNVSLEVQLEDNLPAVEADPARLQQILSNLVGNAIKYNRQDGEVLIEGWANGGGVTLKVADTGYGIQQADLGRIFEPFYRTRLGKERKIPGSGLGLAITHKIVQRHGGTIEVESVQGEGTTFTLKLLDKVPDVLPPSGE